MTLQELLDLANKLLGVRSGEDLEGLLKNSPQLPRPEIRSAIRAAADLARANGKVKAASALEERLTLLEQIVGTDRSGVKAAENTLLPKVGAIIWARLFREYIALEQPERLPEAIQAAFAAGGVKHRLISRVLAPFRT
jgi:hypothetical protein